jgi:hypothetical protein
MKSLKPRAQIKESILWDFFLIFKKKETKKIQKPNIFIFSFGNQTL